MRRDDVRVEHHVAIDELHHFHEDVHACDTFLIGYQDRNDTPPITIPPNNIQITPDLQRHEEEEEC